MPHMLSFSCPQGQVEYFTVSTAIGLLALDELERIERVQRYAARIALQPLFNFSQGAGMVSEERFPLGTAAVPAKETVQVKGKITVSF